VSEQFQNPIIKIVKGSKIIAIFGPRQQDSSMRGTNRRFTIMLQSDVTICRPLTFHILIFSSETP
jgi:hypothetical protein